MKIKLTLPEQFEKLIKKTVEITVIDVLPSAIRKSFREKWLITYGDSREFKTPHPAFERLGTSSLRQNRRTIRYEIDEVRVYLNRGMVNSQQ